MQGPPITPLSKATELLIDMQTKIIANGKAAAKTQAKKAEACKLEAKDLEFSIKEKTSEIQVSTAQIAKANTSITALGEQIGKFTATVYNNEASLANMTAIRENEAAVFKESETDLLELIDAVQRAIAILEREMQGDGDSEQSPATDSVVSVLQSLVQASAVNTVDASHLTDLLQRNEDNADDSEFGAPDAAVYVSHSGDIIEVMEKMADQAQTQLADARKAEMQNQQNFALTVQALQMETKDANDRLAVANEDLAATTERRNDATDALDAASIALADDEAALQALNENCEQGQKNFEAESVSRDEELKAIATALESLGNIGSAEERQYGPSFLQSSLLASASGHKAFEVTKLLRGIAKKVAAPQLAQLASRIQSVMRQGGDDPLAKVKGLISRLLEKLLEEADAEATAKEKCDADLARMRDKKEEQTSTVDGLTATIDSKTAMSSKLKEEIGELKESLAELLESQAEMDSVRKEEHAEYEQAKIDMEQGTEAVSFALKALTEYYAKSGKAHQASDQAASGIIGMLEVVKSDFTYDLARMEETESNAQFEYENLTQANAQEQASKEKDAQYKAKESAALDKAAAEASENLGEAEEQLAATVEYLEAREEQCAAKVETYEERKTAREAEIAGLKEALYILNSEVALVQQGARRGRRFL